MAVRNISVIISANTSQYIAGLNRAASATKQFNSSVGGSVGTAQKAAQANNQVASSMTGVSRGAQAGMNGVQRLNGAMGAGQKFMKSFHGDASLVSKSLGAIKNVAGQAVGALIGFTAIYGVISGARKLFNFATDSIIEFDSAMTESLAILPKASEATRAALEAQAIATSSMTKFKPAEVAEGYYFMISAGMTAAESMASIGDAANFAQAGVMDLEKATEMALDVQTALGLRFKDTEQNAEAFRNVTDIITQAAIDSNATIEQVGEALTNKFATGLNLANRSLEEGAAIIETYASVGVKGKVAGQQAYMFLRDIQRAAIENAGAMKKYGVEVYDANGNLNNLVSIQKQLSKGFGDMTAKQQRISLKELGLPDRSVAAVLPLIAADSKKTEEFYKNNQKASGRSAEVAKKQMESIANQMNKLRNVAAGAFAGLGKSGLDAFMGLVESVGPPLSDLTENLMKFGKEVALPALKPAATLLGGAFVAGLTATAAILSLLSDALAPLAPLLGPLITLITLMKAGQLVVRGFAGAWSLAGKEIGQAKKLFAAPATGAGSAGKQYTALLDGAGQVTSANNKMFASFKAGFTQAGGMSAGFWKSMKAGSAATTTSISSVIGGLGGVASGLTVIATSLIGLAMAYNQFRNAGESQGKGFVDMVNEQVDTTTIEGNQKAIEGYKKTIKSIEDVRKNAETEDSWMDSVPGLGWVKDGLFNQRANDLKEEQKKAEQEAKKRTDNIKANYKLIAKETGMGEDEVRRIAEEKGIDFSKRMGDKDSRKNREDFRKNLKEMSGDALNFGMTMEEVSNMSGDAQDEMKEKADETQKAFSESLAKMVDPVAMAQKISEVNQAITTGYGASFSSVFQKGNEDAKKAADDLADKQAEAYNKGIEGKVKSLEDAKKDAGDKYGKKKTSKEKDAIEAETEAIDNQIDVLKDGKKAKEDFAAAEDPKISIGSFLSGLKAEAQQAETFTKSLQVIQMRLAAQGVDSGVSDEIITQLSALGAEGLPIIQGFATASSDSFAQMSLSMIDSVQKINPELAPTWEDIKRRGDEAKLQVDKVQKALVGLSGNPGLAKAGITPAMLQQFAGLGPEFQQILMTMFDQLNLGTPAEEIANGIKSILDQQNFGQGNIPEAIRTAMQLANANALGDTEALAAVIKNGLSDNLKPEQIQAILANAGLTDLATFFGIKSLTNAGATGTGTTGARQGRTGINGTPGGAPSPNGPSNAATNRPTRGTKVVKTPGGPFAKGWPFTPGQMRKYGLKKGEKYWDATRDMMRTAGVYADGGIERHSAMIGKGTTRIWNEPETGGEAYIPMGSSKRNQSTPILAEVARQFGYGLMKFADGGFYGTAGSNMVGGGRFGTSQGQAAQTIVVPVQSKNETNFNGPIQGVSMEGALAFAERKKRQKNLTR